MENNSGRSDAHTYTSSENIIAEIFQIGMSQPEEIIETSDIETVELVDTENIQLPLDQDAVVSDDVDCPVMIEEVIFLAGLPDPHAAVTNISVNPLPCRRRFASTWKRINHSALCLCCCVRCDGVHRHHPSPTTEDVGRTTAT
jgi:hypothetical protein